MFLETLKLTHFRNYEQLDLALHAPLTLVQGRNAQGKTHLLEAIYYLATSKSSHARTEREVVGWSAAQEPIPYAQIRGDVRRSHGPQQLEILFTGRDGDPENYTKQIRINGVNRRAIDLVGEMRAVLFLPEDIVLVAGSPGERRRYLDIALCQMDRAYCQRLSQFQKVVSQRNSLLKRLREEGASARDGGVAAQLAFWDDQLVSHGAFVMARRYQILAQMDPLARQRHAALSDGSETLHLLYLPSFNPGHLSQSAYTRLKQGATDRDLLPFPEPGLTPDRIAQAYQAKLDERRARELAAGSTLYGPHRDDMAFVVNGRDLRTYGSRGQQRTAALSLKLAELETMTAVTGETPLLLLDDVMSELDAVRRGMLLTALGQATQAIITTTDWNDFTPDFLAQAHRLTVSAGQVEGIGDIG